MQPFTIDPAIERAHTLPAEVYREPDWYARMQERVFARSWQLIDLPELPGPSEALPFTLLPGCLDQPLMLARDEADPLRCLSNVCTHRGTVLLEEKCASRGMRCRYHGRRFAMDGRCLSMPEFERVEGFPGPQDDLPRLPLERLGPLAFTGIAPRPSFAEWIGPVRERFAFLDWSGLRFDPGSAREYQVQASWALYVDNYLEGFHIPFVHPGLNAALDWDAYRTEPFEHGVLQVGVARPGEPTLAGAGEGIGGLYAWLFPNLMLNLYPWGLSVNLVLPRGPDRSSVRYASWVMDPALREKGAGAGLHQVELEDEAVVEAVQRGVRSRLYERGRYSPTREQGVHRFHMLLAQALGAENLRP